MHYHPNYMLYPMHYYNAIQKNIVPFETGGKGKDLVLLGN